MGFLDRLLFRDTPQAPRPPRPKLNVIRRWAPAMKKDAREHERQAAIDALARIGTKDAAAVLLRRFAFDIEPSIVDREEKERVFRAVVAIGEEALAPIRDRLARSERLSWCLRILRELLDDEAYADEILRQLASWDTEYVRDPDPKIQLLAALDRVVDPRVRPAVARFLDDVHEPTRFQAVGALLAQGDPTAAGPLARALAREEAKRTVHRIAEGLAARAWPIPDAERHALGRALPTSHRLDPRGVVVPA